MTSSREWFAVVCALGLAACSGGSRSAGEVKAVRVKASGCSAAVDVELSVAVSCDGGYRSGDLPLAASAGSSGVFERVLAGVPVDTECVFAASGVEHRADVDVHYSASMSRRFGRDEQNPLLVLLLQQDDGVTTFHNAVPRIFGVTASSDSVDMFGPYLADLRKMVQFNSDSVVMLNAVVGDLDGDPLRYRWDDAGLNGTFLDLVVDQAQLNFSLWSNYSEDLWREFTGEVPTAIWIPPLGMTGTAHLTLTVEDEHTGSGPAAQAASSRSSLTVDVAVEDANTIAPTGGVNHWPDVLDMQVTLDPDSSGGRIAPGQSAHVVAVVHDADGDVPLGYEFMSGCPGAFYNEAGERLADPSDPLSLPGAILALDENGNASVSAYFIPFSTPATGVCDVTLYVDDGERGGRTRSARQIDVVEGNPALSGPDITRAVATSQTIGMGSAVGFEIDATSRFGNPGLTYHIEMLEVEPLPDDFLPTPDYFGGFAGETTSDTGRFTWRSAATSDGCLGSQVWNDGSTFHFLVTITDPAAVSAGYPATNHTVLSVQVQCTN